MNPQDGALPPVTATLPPSDAPIPTIQISYSTIPYTEYTAETPTAYFYTHSHKAATMSFNVLSASGPLGPIRPPMTPGPEGPTPELVSARAASSGVLPYAFLFLLWSFAVGIGMVMIWASRAHKGIQIRDWRLIGVAVGAIHLLFLVCLVVTWVPEKFSCRVVYWLVSLLVPACFVAFQLPNARLVGYYAANRTSGMATNPGRKAKWWHIRRRWQKLSVIKRTYVAVAVGYVFQFLLAALMFFGSRRFHASYGLWGEGHQKCLYGVEWIVSILWQTAWANATGLFLFREIRHVKDVYHWALETRLIIVASTPGPLIWMCFMFADTKTVKAVNSQWPPRNWLIPGLALVQIILISFPLYDVARTDAKEKAAENRNSIYGPGSSIDNMINIIDKDAQPLINYAAGTRFNAELIIFLRDVKKWRTVWTSSTGLDWAVPSNREERIACYKHAAFIYFKLVHQSIAAFAINVDGKTRHALDQEFRYAKLVGSGALALRRLSTITPWEGADDFLATARIRTSPLAMKDLEITLAEAETAITLISPETYDATINDVDELTTEGIHLASYNERDAPDEFALTVFRDAYKEVKNEAFYNVWLPYVKSGRFRQDSEPTGETA